MFATLAVLSALSSPIEIDFHADLEGQLARPRCGEAGEDVPDYAAQVAAILRLADDAMYRGEAPPVALLGGDQLGPDLFGRAILKRDGEQGARDLAALFARAGYAAITLGNHDLGFEPATLERFADALAKTGIPIVASNLRCDATRQALCTRLRRELIVERGAERIGILGVLSPSTLPSIAKPRRAGLDLEPLATAIPAGIARLRASGATFVVVMVQVSSGKSGFEEVLALQRGLPRGGVPDLILASGTADVDGQRPTLLVRQDGSPPIVGSAGGATGVTRVQVRPLVGPALAAPEEAPTVDATLVRSRVEERDEATAQLLAHYVESYCERYSVAIGGAGVPTTKDALLAYTLAVLQRETHSEVAFFNGGLIYGPAFPLVGRLTRAKLKRAMPHVAVIGTVSVPGATLGDLLGAAEGTGRMVFAGAARPAPGKPFQINGRPIDKARSYRVATIDFVAEGGLLGDQLKGWKPWQGHPDIRDLVEGELALGSTFDTPASQKVLTTAIGDLAVDLTNTSISNTSMLQDAQLVRAEQRAIKLEATALIQLDHPAHRWDTRATLKYGYARTQPVGKDAAAQETQDLVQLTSQYSYRGLVHPGSSAAIPSPYTRILFETELTQPGMRTYRHAELTHTAGALFTTFKTRLKLRAGGGYRTELLADADSADPDEAQVGGVRGVVEAGATLDPFAVATFRRLSITVEGSVDYFLLEPFGRTEHQTRASGKLSLPLLPLLFVTAGFDVFLVDRETAGRGASFDTTIGLKLHLDGAHQSL